MITDGIINVNKPSGMTSHDVVSVLRRRLKIKRIGHTGTLDPMATGVLPVCIGRATRIIEYYEADMKSYTAELKLGLRTDTLDITGEVLEEKPFDDVTEDAISEALKSFDGWVEQTPPMYSALKVNGKKLYEYAREGKEVEIKSRKVFLEGMRVYDINLDDGSMKLDVTCSKGTYIRTIIDDLGQMLGCGATMTALVRTKSGVFSLEDSAELEDLKSMSDDEIEAVMIQPDKTLVNLGAIELHPKRFVPFCNGMSTRSTGYRIEDEGVLSEYKVYSEGKFAGIGRIREGELIPVKVIGNAGN